MANLKSLLPVVTVPPVVTTVLGSSQTLTDTGAYYINGAYDITLPPIGNFSLGDVIDLTPRLNSESKFIGDTATEILTKKGLTDEVVFDQAISVQLVHNGSEWEL